MLRHLLGFELGQLLKNGVFWIVVAVYALMGFGTMASDNVSIGGGVGNIMRNAPAVVISILGSFRSEEHTSELQSLMRISYAIFCLNKNTHQIDNTAHVTE